MTAHAARTRIQLEYTEMPNLRLKFAQIRRLCGVPHDVCREAVRSLVEGGFLLLENGDAYVRRGAPADLAPRSLASAS